VSEEPPAGEVEVLSGYEPPPPRRTGTSSWKPWVVALVVAFIGTITWLNVSGEESPGPISDDPFDPGARTQPLYPGAVGQLLFTVQEEPAAGQLAGETLWAVQLGTGAATRGPLLLPVGTDSGRPAAPGVPPNRAFALGPARSRSAGILAFLADAPPALGGGRFVYGLDVGSPVELPPAPIAQGVEFAFAPSGSLHVLRSEPDGTWVIDVVGERQSTRVGELAPSNLSLAVTGDRVFLLQSGVDFARIIAVGEGPTRVVLDGWRAVGVGVNAHFLVQRARNFDSLFLFEPPAPPRKLPGFVPDRIVGWTFDRQHYAAVGTFGDRYGLWFVSWPNTPVFMMMPIDEGESIDEVAFDEQARVAFFVHELDVWVVEVGSERAFKLSLPDDAAREVPSGPLVWVP
jgi:hypothetical protein